jgi:hypothetical protein
MMRVLRALLAAQMALMIAGVSSLYTVRYSYSLTHPPVETSLMTNDPYMYESKFSEGEVGVLNRSYWVVDPELISGAYYIENGMLKIESNNRLQVGFGMNWKAPSYEAGWENGSWMPWLPLYWNYHCEVTFVKPEVQWFVVENWIAWENGKSLTAMVWYQHGSLMYSYGAFPKDGGFAFVLGQFDLPSEFNVTIDANYRAEKMAIDWANHIYEVPMQIEPIGTIPKPFTHFQITLMEPGTIYLKKLDVILS